MNLPNKLSVFRICLVPVFLLVLYLEWPNAQNSVYLATGIFVFGAVTDFVDGYIARKYNLATDFGKFIDPLADKILVVSAMVYLVMVDIIPDWFVIIIIGRDFAVSGIRMMAAGKGVVIAASNLGKLKTNSQLFATAFCLLQLWPDIVILDYAWYWWLMLLAVILTLVSGIDYVWKNRKLIEGDI